MMNFGMGAKWGCLIIQKIFTVNVSNKLLKFHDYFYVLHESLYLFIYYDGNIHNEWLVLSYKIFCKKLL